MHRMTRRTPRNKASNTCYMLRYTLSTTKPPFFRSLTTGLASDSAPRQTLGFWGRGGWKLWQPRQSKILFNVGENFSKGGSRGCC